MPLNISISQIPSPSIAVTISLLLYPLGVYLFHDGCPKFQLQGAQGFPGCLLRAPQFSLPMRPGRDVQTRWKTGRLEETCRLEVLEINASWELLSTNDRRELVKNPHAVPH